MAGCSGSVLGGGDGGSGAPGWCDPSTLEGEAGMQTGGQEAGSEQSLEVRTMVERDGQRLCRLSAEAPGSAMYNRADVYFNENLTYYVTEFYDDSGNVIDSINYSSSAEGIVDVGSGDSGGTGDWTGDSDAGDIGDSIWNDSFGGDDGESIWNDSFGGDGDSIFNDSFGGDDGESIWEDSFGDDGDSSDGTSGDAGTTPSGQSVAQVEGTLTYGQTVTSELTSSDGVAGEWRSSNADRYQFQGASGDAVRIAMEAELVDTYLILEAPDGTRAAFNDDTGGTLNSEITTTLSQDGTYTIWATSYYSDDSGRYTLTLEQE